MPVVRAGMVSQLWVCSEIAATIFGELGFVGAQHAAPSSAQRFCRMFHLLCDRPFVLVLFGGTGPVRGHKLRERTQEMKELFIMNRERVPG